MMKKNLVCFVLLLQILHASVFTLNKPGTNHHVILDYYIDESARKSIEDIRLIEHKFQTSHKKVHSHYFSDASFWFKAKIDNTTPSALEELLIISHTSWLDSVKFYIYSPSKNLTTYTQGDLLPFNVRELNHPNINVKHNFEPGISELYIQIKTLDPIVVPFKILPLETFYKEEIPQVAINGILFGIIVALLLYNLILFISSKEEVYGYYVLYLSCFLLVTLAYNGYLYQFVWPYSPKMNNLSITLFLLFYMIAGILFAQSFLQTKAHYLLLHKISVNLIYFFVFVSLLLYVIGGYHYLIMANIAMSLVFSLFMIYMGVHVWIRHGSWAGYFLLATISGVSGTFITSSAVMSLIPYNIWTYKALEIGTVIDALLLSLALAERMRIIQNEKLELQKQRNMEVEKNKKKDEQLFQQSRLAQMGEMISMIAHQWRQPLGAISSVTAKIQLDLALHPNHLKAQETLEPQIKKVLTGVKSIDSYVLNLSSTIDDFRNFYKPGKKHVWVRLDEIALKSLHIIRLSLESDNIKILEEYHSTEPLELYANEMVQVVLNIIKNAQDNFNERKRKNSYIKISTSNRAIVICDNGGGIDEKIVDKIFDPYFSTKDEKNGTGLGLYMSKTIVQEHHHGKISVKNSDEGVCFSINF